MIPRKIHQTFPGELTPRLKEHVDSLKARNPGWEHNLYSDEDAEDFVRDHFGLKMLETYRLISPAYGAARADLLRHLIIFKHGGVYLDIKSDVAKPLDRVLRPDDQYILTQWRNGPGQPDEGFGLHPELAHIPGGEYHNYHLIAVPEHPFTKAAIEKIVANIRRYKPWSGVGKMGVIRTTGPSAYTLAIHPLRATAPHRLITEGEFGLTITIRDYNHSETFKSHYASQTGPVVRLSPFGHSMQNVIEWLRHLKKSVVAQFP